MTVYMNVIYFRRGRDGREERVIRVVVGSCYAEALREVERFRSFIEKDESFIRYEAGRFKEDKR